MTKRPAKTRFFLWRGSPPLSFMPLLKNKTSPLLHQLWKKQALRFKRLARRYVSSSDLQRSRGFRLCIWDRKAENSKELCLYIPLHGSSLCMRDNESTMTVGHHSYSHTSYVSTLGDIVQSFWFVIFPCPSPSACYAAMVYSDYLSAFGSET